MVPSLLGGLPGGPELLVMLLVMLLLFGLPLVLVATGAIAWKRTSQADDDRVEELESRVEELELERELDETAGHGEPGAGREPTDSEPNDGPGSADSESSDGRGSTVDRD